MWTEEARISRLIFTRIQNTTAKTLIYQASFHIEVFKQAMKELCEAKDNLDYHNLARSQSCHMTDGIFGTDIHAAEMESAKIKAYGFLGVAVSSGHKFLRCIVNARQQDRETDWASLRDDLKDLPEVYRRARNAIEHLDEAIHKGKSISKDMLTFSIYSVLHYKDKYGDGTLDFSKEGLEKVASIWDKVISMLEARESIVKRPFMFASTGEE